MNILIVVFVVLAGALNAVQAGANAQLVRSLGRPWLAALLVSLVTAACFALALLAIRLPPQGHRIASTPWWAWTGGICGALYVTGTLFFAQKLGAGVFTGLTVTAGILASLAVDQFGWIGFPQHPAGFWRMAGGLLMVAGVALVSIF